MTRNFRIPALSMALALLLSFGTALPAFARTVRAQSRTSVNRNTNVNVNRNVNVNVHGGGYRGGYYGGCCYHPHPVAAVAAVTATAMVTAAVIGSMVNTLPPSCSVVMLNGFTYQQCGSTWYQPQMVGTTTNYIVVSPPH